MILRNLRAASRLISSFKQVAVAQSSDDMTVVDLGECLEQIVITLGPMLKKSPHKVVLSVTQRIEVRTSPGALYQIITNLVTQLLNGEIQCHSEPDKGTTFVIRLGNHAEVDIQDES